MNDQRDEEMLTRGLRSLAAEMESLEAPESVERKVRAAFRARRVVVPISSKRSSSRYWLVAVAATLLIVMGVVALRMRSRVEAPPQVVAKEQPPAKHEVKPVQAEAPKPVEYQVNNDLPRRHEARPFRHANVRRPENVQAANRVTEIATDFIPLRYTNAANLQDGGQIIRVELPRSALANFGLPVNMDRYNERVKADVLYGVDGLAHAIRFVQ